MVLQVSASSRQKIINFLECKTETFISGPLHDVKEPNNSRNHIYEDVKTCCCSQSQTKAVCPSSLTCKQKHLNYVSRKYANQREQITAVSKSYSLKVQDA